MKLKIVRIIGWIIWLLWSGYGFIKHGLAFLADIASKLWRATMQNTGLVMVILWGIFTMVLVIDLLLKLHKENEDESAKLEYTREKTKQEFL